MVGRMLLVAGCLGATALWLGTRAHAEARAPRQALAALPPQIGPWSVRAAPEFDSKILAVLGVDDYVNRLYATADGASIGLYIGYYRSQRQGDTIHSPANCLPGSGWLPLESGRVRLRLGEAVSGERSPEVNRYLIAKGDSRQIVLYWYHGRGRIVASEYWSKFYMVWDSIAHHRSDGALVRLVTPIEPADPSGAEAERRALEFARALFPLLGRYVPA